MSNFSVMLEQVVRRLLKMFTCYCIVIANRELKPVEDCSKYESLSTSFGKLMKSNFFAGKRFQLNSGKVLDYFYDSRTLLFLSVGTCYDIFNFSVWLSMCGSL